MQRIVLLFTFLISSCTIFGQCPTIPITMSSQAEVNAFAIDYPNCTELLGELTIQGNDIIDLSPLGLISSVEGKLYIEDNPMIVDLQGFESLTNVGSLIIDNNQSLTSLEGLQNLTNICIDPGFTGLRISNNPNLISVTSLTGVTGCLSGFSILNNDSLISLEGLESISVTLGGTVSISENDSLTSLIGLSGLDYVDFGMSIVNNMNLITLAGLDNLYSSPDGILIEGNPALESISFANEVTTYSLRIENNLNLTSISGLGGYSDPSNFKFINNPHLTAIVLTPSSGIFYDFHIENNDRLTDLSLLENISIISGFRIIDNDQLIRFSGLEGKFFAKFATPLIIEGNDLLSDISAMAEPQLFEISELQINNNPLLSFCSIASICDFLDQGGDSQISNNAPGCNSILEVEAQCALINQCPTDYVTLTSQAEVEAFAIDYPNCSELSALTISGPDITNLSGLQGITSISVRLDIKDNPNLVTLDGLSPIAFAEEAQFLSISNNASLESLNDFSGALDENDYGGVFITNNPNLLSLTGLSGITRVDGLHINNNPLLTNLDGLSGIYEVGMVYITENTNLSSLDGLSALEFTLDPKVLAISDNASLLTLSEFSGVLSGEDPNRNGLTIKNNPSLLSLQGLSGVSSISGLNIVNNDTLQNLEGLSGVISASNISIRDNDALISTEGLEMIHFSSSLFIQNNVNLENMYSLTNSSGYTEAVGIFDNPKLVSLSGLEGLEDIQVEGLSIVNNDLLLNLEGLNNLNHVWFNIRLENNELLNDISALETLVLGSLDYWSISGNPNLSNCAISTLCAYLGNDEMANIENNAPDCNSVLEVEAQCNLSIGEVVLSQKLSVFPNPALEILFMNASEDISVERATVYSILGEQLQVTLEKSIDVSSLSEGVYFIKVETDRGTIIKRFIKE